MLWQVTGKKYFGPLSILFLFFVLLGQRLVLAGPPYPTFSLGEQFVGEEQGKGWAENSGQSVRYATAEESAVYRLNFRDGKVYDSSGNLFDTKNWSAIYVMTANGDFYATTQHRAGVFHHSSLVRGFPVACAGDIIVREGVIQTINNRSGHYRPSREALDNVLEQFRTNQVEPLEVYYLEPRPDKVDIPRTTQGQVPEPHDCKRLFSKLNFLIGY